MMKAKTWGKLGKTATAAALLGSVIAGCGSPNAPTNPGTNPENNNAGGSGPDGHPPVTLNMMVDSHSNWPYKEDWPIYKYIKEATNIDFNVQAPPNDYGTAINLAVSSGDMPDLMTITNLATANKHGDSGAFLNIFDHLDEMPNYKKFLEDHPEVKQRIMSADGKSYYLPLYGLERESRRSWLYRADIFEKHGLELPETYDDLYEVAKQLKELYPDSIPLAIFGGMSPLGNMATNFNTFNWQYYDYDKDEWRYGPVEENYKLMLTYLNTFYEEGLIPPDFMSIQRKQFMDLFAQNKSFMAVDYIGSIDQLMSLLKDEIPGFQVKFMPPPAGGPEGKPLNEYSGFMPKGWSVASNTKNREAVLRYLDFLYSPEGIELVSWGKENETYIVENGEKKINPEYTSFADLRTRTGIATYGTFTVHDMEGFFKMFSPEMQEGLALIDEYSLNPQQPVFAFTEEENEELNITGESLKKYMEENVGKFILGQKSFDEWDSYVAEMEKLGVQKYVDIYKHAHDRAKSFVE
ncbi:extracellular solute-binding protein [Paenibacillus senegalensis]|uniref:extracellular solute-binding protein n=1 Tax=Paenibacillus senegalensis TaxID=1465766 RepID=UPI000287AF56|nr:extracellular solute-binding protein [Paenibacillus senegalensis]